MINISVYDYSTLEPIREFSQYDLNRKILIPKPDNANSAECHFANSNSEMAYNQKVTTPSNVVYSQKYYQVEVPNILLKESLPILIYLYVATDDEKKTVYFAKVNVHERPEPSGDYVYEDNVNYITIQEAIATTNANKSSAALSAKSAASSAQLASSAAESAKTYSETAQKAAENASLQQPLDLSAYTKSSPYNFVDDLPLNDKNTYVVTKEGYATPYDGWNDGYPLLLTKGSFIAVDCTPKPLVSVFTACGNLYFDLSDESGGFCITQSDMESYLTTERYYTESDVQSYTKTNCMRNYKFIKTSAGSSSTPTTVKLILSNASNSKVNTFRCYSYQCDCIDWSFTSSCASSDFNAKLTVNTVDSGDITFTYTNNTSTQIIFTGTDCADGVWTPIANMQYTVDFQYNGQVILAQVIGFSRNLITSTTES